MQCWGLLEANEQKWRIQHCTREVGVLCKHPYVKCPNSFDDNCRSVTELGHVIAIKTLEMIGLFQIFSSVIRQFQNSYIRLSFQLRRLRRKSQTLAYPPTMSI